MPSSNVSRLHQYLQAVSAIGSFDAVAEFFAPDVVVREFSNRIVPRGRVSHLADVRAAYERGR